MWSGHFDGSLKQLPVADEAEKNMDKKKLCENFSRPQMDDVFIKQINVMQGVALQPSGALVCTGASLVLDLEIELA